MSFQSGVLEMTMAVASTSFLVPPLLCWACTRLAFTFSYMNNRGGGGGGEGRGEQRRGLRTKALMRDLGTRLECRQKVFVRT